jgi:hypothetical protein
VKYIIETGAGVVGTGGQKLVRPSGSTQVRDFGTKRIFSATKRRFRNVSDESSSFLTSIKIPKYKNIWSDRDDSIRVKVGDFDPFNISGANVPWNAPVPSTSVFGSAPSWTPPTANVNPNASNTNLFDNSSMNMSISDTNK